MQTPKSLLSSFRGWLPGGYVPSKKFLYFLLWHDSYNFYPLLFLASFSNKQQPIHFYLVLPLVSFHFSTWSDQSKKHVISFHMHHTAVYINPIWMPPTWNKYQDGAPKPLRFISHKASSCLCPGTCTADSLQPGSLKNIHEGVTVYTGYAGKKLNSQGKLEINFEKYQE